MKFTDIEQLSMDFFFFNINGRNKIEIESSAKLLGTVWKFSFDDTIIRFFNLSIKKNTISQHDRLK